MLIYLFQWFQFIVQEPLVLTSPRQDHFALRSQKRGGLLGTGTGGGKGTKEWRLDRGYRPKKTGETVDRRQNNGSVKAVSPLRNCCFNIRAWADRVTRTMSVALQLSNNSKRKKSPTFTAQLHLPPHDLFWANLKVQLHLPPLDLLISPGTLSTSADVQGFKHCKVSGGPGKPEWDSVWRWSACCRCFVLFDF